MENSQENAPMDGPDAPAPGPLKRATTDGGALYEGDEGARDAFTDAEAVRVKAPTEGKMQKAMRDKAKDMEVVEPERVKRQVRDGLSDGGCDGGALAAAVGLSGGTDPAPAAKALKAGNVLGGLDSSQMDLNGLGNNGVESVPEDGGSSDALVEEAAAATAAAARRGRLG